MASRLELHEELCELLGSRNVYFQPPESLKLNYPCIVYHKSGISKKNADNRLYKCINQYQGMVIDSDPDSVIPDRLIHYYSMCTLDRPYTSDDLYHNPFTLYY